MPSNSSDSGSGLTRRRFIQTTAAGLTALSAGRVLGANERIGVGVIGFGLIGRILTRAFMAQPDVRIVGMAEAYQPRLAAGAELAGGGVTQYRDFRKMLENKDVDAVVVATPDHWHGMATMLACSAGKDVYVEKPLSLFVKEGRWMVETARRTKRVVQVGTQNRSAPNFQRARDFIRQGKLGEIVSVQDNFFRNVMPGIGNPPDQAPPPELDWEMWLGPSRFHPYNPNRGIYHFRWFWDTSGGQMTNLGQHGLDVVHWISGVKAPKAVYSAGGRRYLKDNGETPDTQTVIIEYPGFDAVLEYREASAGRDSLGMGGLVYYGTNGSISMGRSGFEVFPDAKKPAQNAFATMLGGHPVGGPLPVPEEAGQLRTEKLKDDTGDAAGDYGRHARNFLDCVKSRQDPATDIESGHRVATVCHLANISLRTRRKITWDAEKEEIVGDAEANAMLERPYRKPWDAELKAILG